MIGTDKGWYLSTTLAALGEERSSRLAPRAPRESVLSHWTHRLDAWREIYLEHERPPVLTFAELCREWKVNAETLLTWLRAGLPYAQEGDFSTGAGFTFRSVHVFDWIAALICLPGSEAERRRLRIEDYGR